MLSEFFIKKLRSASKEQKYKWLLVIDILIVVFLFAILIFLIYLN